MDFLSPLSGWEAAARWNRATFDWMAKGWQQWVALMTTVPPHLLITPTTSASAPARAAIEDARPVARAEPKRPARAKARTRTRKATKARARG